MLLDAQQPLQDERVGGVRLVDHHDLRDVDGADVADDLAHGGELLLRRRVGTVHHVEDQVGVADLLHGGAERLDEVVRQVPDETDGVGEGVDPAAGRLRPAHGRVQGGEQGVLHQDTGAGEAVEQGGLAGVGVARDGHRRDLVPSALLALDVAAGLHLRDLPAHLRHLLADPSPVRLDLGLTGATGGHAAAGRAGATATHLPGQRLTPAAQPGQHVLHLGQGDLRLALARLGVLGEDVEDQGGPVDHLDLDDVLEVDELAGAELTVADHRVGARLQDDVPQLLGLAGADVRRRVGLVAALDDTVEDEGARRLGERGELREGVLGVLDRAGRPDADQHHALQAQLPVLDLGDVLQLGGESRDTAQGRALGAVVLLAVALPVDLVAPGNVLFHQGVGPKALREALPVLPVLPVLGKGRRGGHLILYVVGKCLPPQRELSVSTTSGRPRRFPGAAAVRPVDVPTPPGGRHAGFGAAFQSGCPGMGGVVSP